MGNGDEQFIKGSAISKHTYRKIFKPSSNQRNKKMRTLMRCFL